MASRRKTKKTGICSLDFALLECFCSIVPSARPVRENSAVSDARTPQSFVLVPHLREGRRKELAGEKARLDKLGSSFLALCNAGHPTNNLFPSTALLIRIDDIERPLSQQQGHGQCREKRYSWPGEPLTHY